MTRKRDIPPIHPGQLLAEEFMQPSGVTQYRLSKSTGLSPIQVSHIVRGKRSITAETAMRLGLYFGVSPEFWLNAQAHYDLLTIDGKQLQAIHKQVMPLEHSTHL